MKSSLKQLWDTCMWRKSERINDMKEAEIRLDYVREGIMFPRGRDVDGKLLFIYRSRLYTRGSKNLDDMKRMFLYWLERLIREENDDYLTIIFELSGAGLRNVDMDLTRYIITTLKNYYPYSLNYILVFDLPWVLNTTFHIIKRLLPAKAVDRLKNVDRTTIKEYIDEDNMHVSWGGRDDYEFMFIPERKRTTELVNNNSINFKDNNIKKVHFANTNSTDSQMTELVNPGVENHVEGEMLRVMPHIVFTKTGNELSGNVEIVNIDSKPITYKIKTTAPDKFRVRPSTGVLSPHAKVTVNVTLQQSQHINSLNREKFLVMCMSLSHDMSTNSHDLAELWRNISATDASVEQHRLRCALPSNIDETSLPNSIHTYGNAAGDSFGTGGAFSLGESDKQMSRFQQVVSQLNDTTHRMEATIKFNQTLQWISIGLLLVLSIAIVYILKVEIKNSTVQHCLKQ